MLLRLPLAMASALKHHSVRIEPTLAVQPDAAVMQAEIDRRTDYRERVASPPHMPLGAREVPLLEHEHPPLKFARQHHVEIPHHDDPEYARYQAMQKVALSNAVKSFKQELAERSPVEHIQLEDQKLIVRHRSQSKLSQQELADLQKATHFDKKELQQWYKGAERAYAAG